MCDSARSSFNAQLGRVMESLLATAVHEISRIFEGSLSDSRAEVERSREEVAVLKRKLEALEGRLKEDSAARDTEANVTFDPNAPLTLPGSLPREDGSSHGDGRGQPIRVKEDLQLTEREPSVYDQQRGAASVVFKEEEQNPESLSLGLMGPVGASVGAMADPSSEGLKDEGNVRSTKPAQLQDAAPLMELLTARTEPVLTRSEFPSAGFGSVGTPGRESGGLEERASTFGTEPRHASAAGVEHSGFPLIPEAVDDVTVTTLLGDPRLFPRGGSAVTMPPGWPEREKAGPVSDWQGQNLLYCTGGGEVGGAGLPRAPPLHCPLGERPYPCPRCPKAFVSPSHLSVHMRVHTGERPYRCAQCGKSFAHNGNLRAHHRQVHLGRRPYPCSECGKRFSKRGNLRTHLQQVHLGRRPYPCTLCRKAFFSRRDLRTHQLVHAAP
ncbi:hypothetical protein GJAV_G00156190 [Gymnothorax javanicus]|nr:hypothetical protein GJAV_G00156190 [Gymnothorax javanicus]